MNKISNNYGHPIGNPPSTTIDNVISHLQVPQKPYNPPTWSRPDLNPYPVDYLYSGRLLLSLGDTFRDHKIHDNLPDFSFFTAVSYAIKSRDCDRVEYGDISEEEFCRRIGINVIVIGPDSNKYRLVLSVEGKEGKIDAMPFVLIYHSLDDMYYPIVTLERRESNIHYKRSSSILQKLMSE